jgi:hypothetical protein
LDQKTGRLLDQVMAAPWGRWKGYQLEQGMVKQMELLWDRPLVQVLVSLTEISWDRPLVQVLVSLTEISWVRPLVQVMDPQLGKSLEQPSESRWVLQTVTLKVMLHRRKSLLQFGRLSIQEKPKDLHWEKQLDLT